MRWQHDNAGRAERRASRCLCSWTRVWKNGVVWQGCAGWTMLLSGVDAGIVLHAEAELGWVIFMDTAVSQLVLVLSWRGARDRGLRTHPAESRSAAATETSDCMDFNEEPGSQWQLKNNRCLVQK